jgi:hypothetical protein
VYPEHVRRAAILAMVLMAPVGAATLAAPASAASTKRCGNAFSGADQPGFDIRVKHMACSSAKTVTREWVRDCIGKTTCQVHGFHCRKQHTVDLLYRVHCIRRVQRFSFGGGS